MVAVVGDVDDGQGAAACLGVGRHRDTIRRVEARVGALAVGVASDASCQRLHRFRHAVDQAQAVIADLADDQALARQHGDAAGA